MVIGLQMRDVLRPLNLTPAQYTLLSIVAHRPALSATQLARRLGVKLPSIAELIATLECKKWISRIEDQNNRRVLRILIIPAGRKILAQSERLVDRLEAPFRRSSADGVREISSGRRDYLARGKSRRFSPCGRRIRVKLLPSELMACEFAPDGGPELLDIDALRVWLGAPLPDILKSI
ncbi:MAG: MarR family transcriptional regulator [Stellaceae bacterium]